MRKTGWKFAAAWLWLSAYLSPPLLAAGPHYAIEDLGIGEGALAVTQTRDGYLWLGTGDGLVRFDGLRFKRYGESEIPELKGSKVVRLFEDSQTNLWVGTDSAGVLVVSPAGKVTDAGLGDPRNEGPLVAICEDTAGGIWMSLSKGQVYWYSEGKAHLLISGSRGLLADDSGLVWFGAPDGTLKALRPTANARGAPVFSVVYDDEIRVSRLDFLLSSKRGGYWRLADNRIQWWKGAKLEKDFGPYPWTNAPPVLAACEDREGNLVVGTFGNGVYWMTREGECRRVEGLSHNYIFSLAMDRDGSLWVVTGAGGLERVKRQDFVCLEGTERATAQSVCEDASGGLWIGYFGERVDHWSGGALQHYTTFWPTNLPPEILAEKANNNATWLEVRAVLQDRAGDVWAGGVREQGSLDSTCFRLQGDRFLPENIGREVAAIFQDRQGTLWLGTQGGLARRDPEQQTWQVLTTKDGLSSDDVRAIADDAEGNLWIGTQRGGLNCLRNGKFTVFRRQTDGLPSDNISSLYADAQGVLWVGTPGGLARYSQNQWTRYTTGEGLARDRIGYLVEDGLGFLWMGSGSVLMRVAKQELNELAQQPHKRSSLTCRVFGRSDGLPSECTSGSQPGACRARSGILYFPTAQGVAAVNPAQLLPNTNPPPVVIDTVLIDDRMLGPETFRSPAPHVVVVPAGSESLEIGFASLNLSAPTSAKFRYWMEGLQKGWLLPTAEHSVRYPKLWPGHYQFHVIACNQDGVWNETGASLAVTVLPAFWQTWWFLAVSVLCLLGLIVGSVHYVSTQRLQHQLAVLRQQEALERERARIARDLHDQLGANLTQVALLGEMAESDKHLPKEVAAHARQISQTARETTHALDEIVWTVNPSNDTLDGLVNYVCKYAQDYFAMAGLRYRLEVPSPLPTVPISPELRHNVFLAAKEAINNVIKHAHASSAWLRLRLVAAHFVLEIEDDGRGLKQADLKKGRNGLRNMRKRMEDAGGAFEASPRPEGGTVVRLTAPLGNANSGKTA
jgi:ligand-binding sensor domain-containing protein/signal transduction histidine kinase